MMLIFVPPCRTAVFLARIVMPFSRSRSPVSMTRSLTSWFARKAPDCQSMASTSVVFPWSTWATMAMLRMSERSGTDRGYRRSAGLPGGVVDLEKVGDFGQPPLLDEPDMVGVGVVALVGRLVGELHRDPEAELVLRAHL